MTRNDQASSLTASGRAPQQPWLVAENAAILATYEVRQVANERGVRLASVRNIGASGPTMTDVLAEANRQDIARRRAQASAAPKAAPSPPARPLPTFTVSGVDPSELLSVPPAVRPAMAAAETRGAAFNIKNKYGGLSDADAKQLLAVDKDIDPQYGGWSWTWG